MRSDTYVYAVLSCLPWVGRELYEKKEQDLERLLKHIEIYVRKRSRKHMPGLRVWRSDRPHPQEEYLDCLWAQVRPHTPPLYSLLLFLSFFLSFLFPVN